MTRTVAVVLLAAILAALSFVVGRQARVSRGASSLAYISLQRVLNELPEQKAGAGRLQQMQQEKSRELGAMQQQLEAARRRLAQSSSSAASRAQLEQEEQRMRGDLERATAQAQTDLQALQRQFQNDLRSRLTPVFQEVARGRNVQILLNEDSAVMWAGPGFDLTDAVIARLQAAATRKP